MNSQLYYEDVQIGDELGPLERIVHTAKVDAFLRLRGGFSNPNRFMNDAYARKEGLPGPIVPGSINIAMLSQLLTGWSPTVTLKKLDVVFRQVVLHNMPLRLRGIVTDKVVIDGEPQIACDVFMENEEGTPLLTGHATVVVPVRSG
jgi:acyl dehydratase